MAAEYISRNGVYYDLNRSPYKFVTPHGKVYRFSSKKKLEIFERDIVAQLRRVDKFLHRNYIDGIVDECVRADLYRESYEGLYKKVEA